MSTVMVNIMLHGLVALVPITGTDGRSNQMTALLVKAKPPTGVAVKCFEEHRPILTVKTLTSAECTDAKCTAGNQSSCTCQLDSDEISISIEPQVVPAKTEVSKRPPSVLPFDDEAAGNFGYIANLSRAPLNAELDPAFLDPIPPTNLAARMTFPFESLTSCALASLQDEGGKNIHALSFRPLNAPEESGEMSQALAQMVMAHLTVPDAPVQRVTLKITDFGGANPRHLTLKPSLAGYVIELENGRDELSVDDPCEDGVARDFASLYDLAKNPPAWNARPIPHIKYTRWKSARDIEAPGCDRDKEPTSRPVCPIGVFNPENSPEVAGGIQ